MKKSEKGRVERMRSIENSLRSSAKKRLTGPSSHSGALVQSYSILTLIL